MTAREKLVIDHPQLINETFWGGCVGCPDRHGYLTRPAFCKDKLYPSTRPHVKSVMAVTSTNLKR